MSVGQPGNQEATIRAPGKCSPPTIDHRPPSPTETVNEYHK